MIALLLALACGSDPSDTRSPATPSTTAPTSTAPTSSTPTPPTTSTPTELADGVPDHVALPYVEVGDAAPEGTLALVGEGPLAVAVTGPFEVTGDLSPLAGDRALTVRYTGATSAPALASGEAVVTLDGVDHVVVLAAVVGDPDLPTATWTTDEWGTSAVVALPSAPFPADGGGPWYDDDVLIVAPAGLSLDAPVNVVTHLHGHYATLLDTVGYQKIVEQHAISGRDAVLVVPQGPVEAASGDFGQVADPGGHEALVRDAVSVLYRDGLVEDARLGQQVMTAHSGGYLATADILQAGGLPIDVVHLFDALYGDLSTYEDFALGGGVLRSSYTTWGGTVDNNELLADWLAGEVDLGDTFEDAALAATDVTVGWSASAHDDEVHDRRNFARWLAESGLPPRALAPPELLAVTPDRVSWRLDRALPDRLVAVEGSDDGVTWRELGRDDDGALDVVTTPWVRLVALTGGARSEPSDTYGSTGADWLVVDGFDRVFYGSWTSPTHDFAARVGTALPVGYASASNEAVVTGVVDPADYDAVLWLLGDESTADDTFDDAERALIEDLVGAGVPVVVSGSEVGYATDAGWFLDVLGADYVADDAGTTRAGGFDFGVTYPEDYPDVLGGGSVLWSYDTGGGAAIVTSAGIVVGFPLETLAEADLGPALAELAQAL